MKISAALPTGVAALLFESARRRRDAEERLAGLLREAGYDEAILPILDYVEPYEALLTPASRGELYRFIDRDGELLALRADFTPMLARLLAPRIQSLPLPLRVFYRGDVVRYEEERAGRQREFYQLGAELLGLAGEPAEREMLRLFLDALDSRWTAPRSRSCSASPARSTASCWRPAPKTPRPWRRRSARRERGEVRRLCRAAARRGRDGPAGAPGGPRGRGGRAPARLLALRDELAGRLPGVRLSIDLAEFAQQGLDPRAVPTRRRGTGPTTTAWSSAPTPAPRRCRWAAAGATTGCSAASGPRCRRSASR